MTFNNGKNARAYRDARQRNTEHPPTKLSEIIPNDLAYSTIEAVLWYLDRLAIHLFPRERTAELTELSERDQQTRDYLELSVVAGTRGGRLGLLCADGQRGRKVPSPRISSTCGEPRTRGRSTDVDAGDRSLGAGLHLGQGRRPYQVQSSCSAWGITASHAVICWLMAAIVVVQPPCAATFCASRSHNEGGNDGLPGSGGRFSR